eukprot:TRINITY_DN1790_c0_g1_i2.p1 TRINITY_DN1790_c0_g1~~TRINITY_DN1790_c0_g1_i2.p1  ORF type:complete len:212 (-),score=24.78 TRINITY_DN1790_c0_g1_i2:170-805(-)
MGSCFDELPLEILAHVLGQVSTVQSLLKFSETSKIWNDYLNSGESELVWKEVVLNLLGGEKKFNQDWRTFCTSTGKAISSMIKLSTRSGNIDKIQCTKIVTNLVRIGHYKLLQRYLDTRAPFTLKENLDQTFPFTFDAFSKSHIPTIRVLLDHDLVNFSISKPRVGTVLNIALSKGHEELVEVCMSNPNFQLPTEIDSKFTLVLLLAAAKS